MILRNKPKTRKPIIIFALILFLLWILMGNQLRRLSFFSEKEKIISPVLPPTEEEKIKDLLKMSGMEVRAIKSLDDSFEIIFSDNLLVLFSKKKEYLNQIASLQFILSRSKIEGKIPQKIDLRFEKPVLTY